MASLLEQNLKLELKYQSSQHFPKIKRDPSQSKTQYRRQEVVSKSRETTATQLHYRLIRQATHFKRKKDRPMCFLSRVDGNLTAGNICSQTL